MPTQAEIEAAAHAVKRVNVCGLTIDGEHVLCCHPKAENQMVNTDCDCWLAAMRALEAAETVRSEEQRRNCKHPRRIGNGILSSDGSSQSSWSCPDCGAHGETFTPPRDDGEGFRAMMLQNRY